MRILLFTIALLAVAGALAGSWLILRDPREAARRFELIFRRPDKPAKPAGSGHYYKRYWS
jgi:hypothetical protein